MSNQIITQAIAMAEELTSQTVPVVVIQPGIKTPKTNPHEEPRPDGRRPMWVIVDPDQVPDAFIEPANLAVLLGTVADFLPSPLIAVGLDLYKDKSVADLVKNLGVTRSAAFWMENTGRGGITLIYADPGMNLKRDTTQEGGALDLLTNGQTLIPPSNSDGIKGGGPYSWFKGHSPFDIPFSDLETPPKALLEWWMGLHPAPAPRASTTNGQGPDIPSKHQGPIPEGTRNTELASRAGYLHRTIPDNGMVRDLVHAINIADCKPPLARSEVENILKSILPKEGASHFRGVWPTKLEVVK